MQPKLPASIQQGVDPWGLWEEIGELGDGAFGKVKKVARRDDPERLAAAKASLFATVCTRLQSVGEHTAACPLAIESGDRFSRQPSA